MLDGIEVGRTKVSLWQMIVMHERHGRWQMRSVRRRHDKNDGEVGEFGG